MTFRFFAERLKCFWKHWNCYVIATPFCPPPKELKSHGSLSYLLKSTMDYYYEPQQAHSDGRSWLSGSNFLTRIMGFSFFASILQSNSYMVDSVRLFLLGTIIESGRRFCQWLIERFWFRQYTKPLYSLAKKLPLLTRTGCYYSPEYSITAQFTEGDPAYEWIILFLVC